jgi:hypothetical protein
MAPQARRLLVVGLLATACGGSIDAGLYEHRCAADTDCVAVHSGELCQTCGGCPNAAINASALSAYEADARAISDTCPPKLGTSTVACAACLAPTPVCSAGVCALR